MKKGRRERVFLLWIRLLLYPIPCFVHELNSFQSFSSTRPNPELNQTQTLSISSIITPPSHHTYQPLTLKRRERDKVENVHRN